MSQVRVLPAVERFLEAERRDRKDRQLRAVDARLQADIGRAFKMQGRAFVRRLESLASRFATGDPTPVVPTWEPLFDEAAAETRPAFIAPLEREARAALELGVRSAALDIGIRIRMSGFLEAKHRSDIGLALGFREAVDPTFDVPPEDAVNWLSAHAAENVTGIDETTRHQLQILLRDAVEAGMSYGEVSRIVAGRYQEFSVVRAEVIAVYESALAYSEGQRVVVRELERNGIAMTKSWLTAGGERVCPICVDNEAAGRIAWGADFPSGNDMAPAHVRCRCDVAVEPAESVLSLF